MRNLLVQLSLFHTFRSFQPKGKGKSFIALTVFCSSFLDTYFSAQASGLGKPIKHGRGI